MAIQYYMRAFNTALVQYVDWVVNDAPDSTGTFSGYPTFQLVNITVNRVVQSKVANFLKQNQSLGGTDGYFFHVNSYDWRNATAPIFPPTNLVGFAVERGIASAGAVSGATNTSPIIISTAAPHTLATGQVTTISGVTGNVAANGTWPIVVLTSTTFSLTGSVGSGTYGGAGNVYIPNDMSSLIWDEVNNVWRLATIIKNNPGDSVTLGVSQSLKVNNFILDGYLAIGLDPADTGAIRLSNNSYIFSEANPTGTDIQLIGADTLNRIKLGVNATDTVYIPGIAVVDGYIQHDGTGSNTAQTTGFIREVNGTNIVAFRGTAALAGSDIVALGSSSNNVVLGDSVNTGVLYRTSSGSVHQFQTNSVGRVEIGDPFIRFVASGLAGAPSILQTTAGANTTGQTLTIQAQNGGTGTSTGGILSLTSGTGTTAAGSLDLLTGGVLQTRIFPDSGSGTTNGVNNDNSILLFQNALRFDTAQPTPSITQDQINASSTNGQAMTVRAQNAIGATSTGGILNLSSGTGTTAPGRVNISLGNTPEIVIIPNGTIPAAVGVTSDLIVIAGNLEVKGVVTTIDSTVIDIIGRVIHANWSDPVASPNVAVPTQIAGYSVHRGNTSGIPRDGAAWLWTEGAQVSGSDGYWKAATILGDGYSSDNYTIANSPAMFGVMASNFSSSPDPNPILGYVASTGSLRVINNAPSVVARSIQATTTLNLVASNGTLALPQGTITVVDTTQFTTAGSLLVQSSAGVQTLTYTGKTGTTFTGVVGGTGNIVTGGIIAQTNASTFVTAASNTLSLPQGTINVNSTTGFPATGTLRIFTNTATGGVQTVAYTGVTATTFTGCTGGTGVLNTGNAISLVPLPGISDLVLLGTDFGNRILHGAPTNNTGHIFNTPTTFFYDFQINSVSQVQLRGDTDGADSFIKTITIAPTVNTPKIYQVVQPDTGANNGFNLKVQAQAGQQQTGGNANNNGGNAVLASGSAGTGGGGAAGINGSVDINTGTTLKMRVFPTTAVSAGDNNSILYFENLFRVDTAQTAPRIRQDNTGNGTGETFTLQAQNSTTNGGNLTLTSGTATTAGDVNIQTGAVSRIIVHPTFTEFRDAAEALRITPVSAGTTQITYASTVTAAQINQTQTTVAVGAPMTIQSQVTTLNGSTGGNLSLIAGNATGTTSTGGNAILTSGTGTTVAGNTQLQTGGVDKVIVHPTFTEFRDTAEALRITPVSAGSTLITFASTATAATINQTTTAGATGAVLTVQAQNAATTGGALNFTTGTGATNPGNMNLQIGGTTLLSLLNTATSPNTLQWLSTTTAPFFNQGNVATASATGAAFTIQAQNATGATSTGGQLALTSGTGTTTAGNVNIQCGGTTIISAQPTLVALTQPLFQYGNAVTAPLFRQADKTTNAATGEALTIQAQNETGTTSTGGALNLTSGTGTTTHGAVNLQVGLVTTASVVPNKFVFNKGSRRNVTAVTGTYQVLVTDDYLAITTIAAPFTITMPLTPTLGDTYKFKDAVGNAATNNVTISGNGVNIDGAASVVIGQNYSALELTYTGTQWSIS